MERKSSARLRAEEAARDITRGRESKGKYKDEDEMIEDYRELREEFYWDELDRRNG